MPIIDIDFDIAGIRAASWYEETTCTATDFRSDSGERAVCEANVEQAGVGYCSSVSSGKVEWD